MIFRAIFFQIEQAHNLCYTQTGKKKKKRKSFQKKKMKKEKYSLPVFQDIPKDVNKSKWK